MQFMLQRSLFCALLSLSAFLSSCGLNDQPKTKEAMVRPVKIVTVSQDQGALTTRFPAVIEANQIADLSFPQGGVLSELAVTEAQEVNAGQLIAKLDPRDFQSRKDQATAQFEKAEQEYQRALRLQRENAIATSVVEQRKSQRDVAKSQLDSAQKALEEAAIQAPFSGIIAKIFVEPATTVGAGQAVATLMNKERLEAVIDVPADFIAKAKTRVNDQVFLQLSASPESKIPLEFKEASLLADPASQTYQVRFVFTPPEQWIILPGMNGTVEVTTRPLAAGEKLITVPLSAILSDGEQRFVWVIDPETMKAGKRPVTLREGIGEMVVVTEGLATGEMIAGAGASFLAEGLQVRPWNADR